MLKIIFFPLVLAWWIIKLPFRLLNVKGMLADILNIKFEKN